MQDRTPTKPRRVLITPEDGSAPYYATWEPADEPVTEGTALNKANLLQDTTAALMGLGTAATPDDMLKALANKSSSLETALNGKIVASTTALTPGTSALATGVLYVVYK